MSEDVQVRLAAVEARLQEVEALANLALRLLAVEKPVSALLQRYGASESQDRAVHGLLDDIAARADQGGIYAPSFSGFTSDLFRLFPTVRHNREFVAMLLDTLKLDRPTYQKLHTYVTDQGWPHWS